MVKHQAARADAWHDRLPLFVLVSPRFRAPRLARTPVLRVSGPALYALTLALFALEGCGRSARTYDRYVPPADLAQQALQHVLQLWQEGKQTGLRTLPEVGEVYVVDSVWQQGRPLRSFELLGETPGDGPRTLAVRLMLDNPRQETIVRYYLVGIRPLWIFRQEDYDMISHWDHAHAPSGSAAELDDTAKP